MALASGHTVQEMDPQEKQKFLQDFKGSLNSDMIILQPGGWLVSRKLWLKFQERIYNFKFRPDDVVIMTYSKCGTTWMQEIVWNMMYNPNSDRTDSKKHIFTRSPYLDADTLDAGESILHWVNHPAFKDFGDKFNEICPGKDMTDGLHFQITDSFPTRRAIKTHLPFSLLPPNLLSTCKVIFVARNPKDMCLSSLHHHKLMTSHNYVGSQDDFVDYFVRDRLIYGSFANMVKEGWAMRNDPNMHFVFYEDLRADTVGELKKINDFIGLGLNEQQLKNVQENTSFSAMKASDQTTKEGSETFTNKEVLKDEGGFIHKGKSGGWREKLTEAQNAKIDEYVKRHFEGTGLEFKY